MWWRGEDILQTKWLENIVECGSLALSYSSEGSPALAVCRPQSLNSLKLNIPRFLHNCLPISCGDIGSGNRALKVHFMPLWRSCPLKTILLSDLVGCDSPLQIVMAFWGTIIVSRGMSHPTQKVWIQTKRVPNCHHYLHRAVTPNWMGSIALW